MGVLADHQIRKEIKIEPFAEGEKRPGQISYGLSSYGYDVRLGRQYKIFTNILPGIIDPKQVNERAFYCLEDVDYCDIPPNSYVLAQSLEYFEIPRDVIVICVGKSTYARSGILANVTPLEPHWRGKITIEVSNAAPLPARIYSGEGILQLLFLRGETPCEKSYADKQGKYQNQPGLILSKVD